MYAGLESLWDPGNAARWLALAGTVSGYVLWVLWRGLAVNQRPGEQELLPSLGAGTLATYARGVLLAGTAGFIFSPRPPDILAWAPMALFTVAESLDYFDGYLARRGNHMTALGEAYDLELDGLGMLVGSGLAVWYRTLPPVYLLIGFASYLYRFGVWIRKQMEKPVRGLPPSSSRRPIAGLMMGFLSVMLWPIVGPPATALAGVFFTIPFLASFTRDWLVVSNAIDPNGERYRRLRSWTKVVLLDWAPLPARGILVLTLAVQNIIGWGATVQEAGLAVPFAIVEITAAVLIGLGIAGRAAALIALFPVGLTIVFSGVDAAGVVNLAGCLSILVLGTGRYSLWKPEEAIFSRRAGEGRA